MFNQTVTRLCALFDSGALVKNVLYTLIKVTGVFLVVHGWIGGLSFIVEVIDHDYLDGFMKFTGVLISVFHMVIFSIAGALYYSRANGFSQSSYRGLIHQWLSVTRYGLEVFVLLVFGFFCASALAVFVAGPEGTQLTIYMLNTSFNWITSLLGEIFSRDSEVLARVFSFLIVIFGGLVSWGIYYSSSFFLELIETADRFFKRIPHDKK